MRKVNYLPVLIFSIILFSHGHLNANDWIRVTWVSDGDTIVVESGQRVRYNGVNAPEIAHEDQGIKAEPYAYAAKEFNLKLVKAKNVRLELDIEKRDRYGRLLAYVFLPDGTFVNAKLIAHGYAYYLPGIVNRKYAKLLLNAQRESMSNRKGLWRYLNENHEGYIGSRQSKRFHLKTCPFGKKIKHRNRIYFANKWDAFWAGYAPAKKCIKSSSFSY